MRSLSDNQFFTQTLGTIIRTASENGAEVDSGADSDARTALIHVVTWTNGVHKFTVEARELSADAWVPLTADELHDRDGVLDPSDFNSINIVDATTDATVFELDLLTTKKQARVVQTVTGASGNGLIAGALIQNGHPLRFAGNTNPSRAGGVLAPDALA